MRPLQRYSVIIVPGDVVANYLLVGCVQTICSSNFVMFCDEHSMCLPFTGCDQRVRIPFKTRGIIYCLVYNYWRHWLAGVKKLTKS